MADAKPQRRQEVAEDGAGSLTTGKLNAVRAAFKAGVKPSAIARQFGISQSDVRKALAINSGGLGIASDFNGLPDDWRLGSRARQLNVNTVYATGDNLGQKMQSAERLLSLIPESVWRQRGLGVEYIKDCRSGD